MPIAHRVELRIVTGAAPVAMIRCLALIPLMLLPLLPRAAHGSDTLADFRSLLAHIEDRIKTDTNIDFNPYTKGWAKRQFDLIDLEYDVRRTDSLVSPFVAVATFRCGLRQSRFFKTKQEAEGAADLKPIAGDIAPECRVTFAFQDDAWVVKTRQYRSRYSDPALEAKISRWKEAEVKEPDAWPCVLLLQFY